MPPDDEVTLWLQGLAAGDARAAERVWRHYYERLIHLARHRLGPQDRRAADEEDVAASALYSFLAAAERGRFPRLADRDDLWKLLVTITARKATALRRRGRRAKRGAGLVRGDSLFARPGESSGLAGLDGVAGAEPTPEFAVAVVEECQRLLAELSDPTLAEVALLKVQGYTNDEIAGRLDCAPRTVERKLERIRRKWSKATEADSAGDDA